MKESSCLFHQLFTLRLTECRCTSPSVATIVLGLLPVFWGHGAGASVMRRIAAPMVGGMVSAMILTLIVIPVVYSLWLEWSVVRSRTESPSTVSA